MNLVINVIVQAKVNQELATLGTDLTCTDVNEGYITSSKSKINSTVQDAEENNVLPPQEPAHNDNNHAFGTIVNLISPPTDNCNSQYINQNHMKSYYGYTYCCFLDYFNDPLQDDSVMHTGDIAFQ